MIIGKEATITPAYIAGMLDSDGSLSISKLHATRKTPNYRVIFQVQWKLSAASESVLLSLKKTYGGAICYPKIQKTSLGKSQTVKYCLTGKKLDKLLKDIEPYVLLKYEQVKLAQKLRRTTFKRRGKPNALKRMHDWLFERMKFVNKNGGSRNFTQGIVYVRSV